MSFGSEALPGGRTVALVTGASSAIGSETAQAFAKRGACVVLSSRDKERSKPTIDAVEALGVETMFVPADLTVQDEVDALIKAIDAEYGRLDFAFNSAGGTYDVARPLNECTIDDWNTVIGGNLLTLWNSMRAELSYMRQQGSGAVVNNIGVMGFDVAPNLSIYAAAKHGAVGLTKAAAVENAGLGIRVNAVAPGITERHETPTSLTKRTERAQQVVPMGRMAQAKEVASAATWLASDESSFVTGHVLVVDGGWIAGI